MYITYAYSSSIDLAVSLPAANSDTATYSATNWDPSANSPTNSFLSVIVAFLVAANNFASCDIPYNNNSTSDNNTAIGPVVTFGAFNSTSFGFV